MIDIITATRNQNIPELMGGNVGGLGYMRALDAT